MSTPTDPVPIDPESTVRLLVAAVLLGVLAALIPAGVGWLYDGSGPHESLPRLAWHTVRIAQDHRWHDPATAYPPSVRAHMPASRGWWQGAGMTTTALAATAFAAWQRRDVAAGRHHLGRRPYDPRGRHPRAWARPRDLRDLQVPGPQPGRFSLGRLDGHALASDRESHVALVAPTRSGKTTRYVIPWLLEHDGPAVVTSTKTDVLDATRERRAQLGAVYVWDPFGPESSGWDPLEGCAEWTAALQQARWLADASQVGESDITAYWSGEAAKLLAPLLHAAALDQRRTIDDVRRWIDTQDTEAINTILRTYEATAAVEQLKGATGLDDRNRGSTFMSAGSVLAAYRFPQVGGTLHETFTTADLLDGASTLYVIASDRHQRLLTPLIVAMLSTILDEAARRAHDHQPLQPTLRVLLDEAANIAPLRDLPALLSQAAGYGVRIATVWQSLGQIHDRYRDAADAILANSTTKLFMGPVTDQRTWSYLSGLLGDEETLSRAETSDRHGGPTRSVTASHTWRPKAVSSALQQLGGGRAVLLAGDRPPAVVRAEPWYRRR